MILPAVTSVGLGTACLACLVHAAAAAEACLPEEGQAVGCTDTDIVQTQNGPVVGFVRQDDETSQVSVATFWGMPFAEPPVGLRRFQAPQRLERKWDQPLTVKKHSTICYQAFLGSRQFSMQGQSEDCLFLNVYTPTNALGTTANLPVMVWVYGGGFMMGDAYQSVRNISAYDGSALAGRYNVVLVTLNYRVGGLGFFSSDALRKEDEEGSTGNMAMRDQRLAMEWVRDNIANFGGNPKRVTIFGESAGGFSMAFHLVSRRSWPLFHQVIMESGTSKVSWFFQPYEGHAKEFYAQWARRIGCPHQGPGHLKCLRGMNATKLLSPPGGITVASPLYDASLRFPSMSCGPVIDGTAVGLEGPPLKLMQQGRFNKVPLLTGGNLDDGRMFQNIFSAMFPGPPQAYPGEKLIYRLSLFFEPDQIKQILAVYPEWEFRTLFGQVDWDTRFSRMIRDLVFQCSNRGLVDAFSKHNVPAWLYTFSFDLGFMDEVLEIGDSHGMEVWFVFRKFLKTGQSFAPHVQAMSDIIGCKWATFAKTGKPSARGRDLPPNCKGVHEKYAPWPQYTQMSRQYYSLKFPPEVRSLRLSNMHPDDEFPSDLKCNALDQLTFPWPGARKNTTERPVFV